MRVRGARINGFTREPSMADFFGFGAPMTKTTRRADAAADGDDARYRARREATADELAARGRDAE